MEKEGAQSLVTFAADFHMINNKNTSQVFFLNNTSQVLFTFALFHFCTCATCSTFAALTSTELITPLRSSLHFPAKNGFKQIIWFDLNLTVKNIFRTRFIRT